MMTGRPVNAQRGGLGMGGRWKTRPGGWTRLKKEGKAAKRGKIRHLEQVGWEVGQRKEDDPLKSFKEEAQKRQAQTGGFERPF